MKCCPGFLGTETVWLADAKTGRRVAELALVAYCQKHGARGDLKPAETKVRPLLTSEWLTLKASRKGFAPFYVIEDGGRYVPEGAENRAEIKPVAQDLAAGQEPERDYESE